MAILIQLDDAVKFEQLGYYFHDLSVMAIYIFYIVFKTSNFNHKLY